MAAFQFRVKDKAGRTRKGTLEADSLAQAERCLFEQGLKIIDLSPIAKTPELVFKADEGEFRGLKFGAPQQTDYSPTLAEKIEDLFDEEGKFWKLVATVLVFSLLVFLLNFQVRNEPKKSRRNKQKVVISIPFKLQNLATVPSSATVELVLPEIPLRERLELQAIKQSGDSHLFEIDFVSTRKPSRGKFLIHVDKVLQGRSRGFVLSGDPLTSSEIIRVEAIQSFQEEY